LDRDCILSAEYNWTTRDFAVSLQMCTDAFTERNCYQSMDYDWMTGDFKMSAENLSLTRLPCVRNLSLASTYDAFEVTMRTVYRQNKLVPMRIYRNMTLEYQALIQNTNDNQNNSNVSIPFRFSMQYAGTKEQVASTSLRSVQTLMHLFAYHDSSWSYRYEYDDSGRHRHGVVISTQGGDRNMDDACPQGYTSAYTGPNPEYACLGVHRSESRVCLPRRQVHRVPPVRAELIATDLRQR
tara:strand:- start:476 stop:1192 length:717 start_codon:yes stop_codon:yes gene_type:complete